MDRETQQSPHYYVKFKAFDQGVWRCTGGKFSERTLLWKNELCCGKINGDNLDKGKHHPWAMTFERPTETKITIFCIKFCYGQIKTRSISQSPNIPTVSHEDIHS